MNKNEIIKRLTEVFRDIFDDDSIVITEKTTANDIDDWDSIEHINLRFKMREVSGMKNVGEMIDIISKRGK